MTELRQDDHDRVCWRPRLVCVALVLAILAASAGFNLAVVFLAFVLVTVVILLVFPGRHVVIVIPRKESIQQLSTDHADRLPPTTPPAPFRDRLAQFLQCNENDLDHTGVDRTSKMKFWSAVPIGPRHNPKPVWLIRMILRRIHHLVHGSPFRR